MLKVRRHEDSDGVFENRLVAHERVRQLFCVCSDKIGLHNSYVYLVSTDTKFRYAIPYVCLFMASHFMARSML